MMKTGKFNIKFYINCSDAIIIPMLTLIEMCTVLWAATEEELTFGIVINIYGIKLEWVGFINYGINS